MPFAAAPQLAFKLRVDNSPADQAIQTIALRCQIQIEATRRRYSAEEQQRLSELFGEPERWSQTLRSMLWTHAQTSSCRGSTARRSSTSTCPARSTSTWPRRSTSTGSTPATCR